MTDRPTVEPAGVSEQRLRELRDAAESRREFDYQGPWTDYIAVIDECLAARQQIKTLADKLFDADNCHSADHAAAMAYFGQAMEHDQWRIERDEVRQQLAEMRGEMRIVRKLVNALENIECRAADAFKKTSVELRQDLHGIRADAIEALNAHKDALAPTSQPSRGTPDGDCPTCAAHGKPHFGWCSWKYPERTPEDDCAQPERQGADKFPANYNGRELYDFAPKKRPSPPPTDDIVAFLRDLNHYIYRDQNQMLDRAIAALGEKGRM